MEYDLVIENVYKSFGSVNAVKDMNAAIPKGSIYGFIGPNGAGKTTTIRMIMSILYPDEGRIAVFGDPNPESMRHRLGYLPEEKGLYKKMKVGELVAYFGKLKGINRAEANSKAVELLNRFGLGDWVDKKCDSLSKGMGQKVQILSTLIHEPELVILDEPFSGLDPVNMEVVREIVLQMKQEGKTVIFSTHVMEQAEQMCDYIMLINKGEKVLDGPLSQIKKGRGRAVMLDFDGDSAALEGLPGVIKVRNKGKHAELLLADDADTQAILAKLVGKINIRRFDTREPSLHEIFIRVVGGGEV